MENGKLNALAVLKKNPASYWLDRAKNNYRLKKRLFTLINNLTIVPVSEWLGNIVRQSFFSEFPLKVINNEIGTNVIYPLQDNAIRNKYNLENKFIILGIACFWSPRKGLTDFIKLSKILDSDYRIILVG